MTQYVINCLLGAALVTLSTNLFYLTHQHPLNLTDLFYTLTVLKPSIYVVNKSTFLTTFPSFLVFSLHQESSLMQWGMDLLVLSDHTANNQKS